MYAKVVINQISNKTDRLYDYEIPGHIQAGVGSRVIVPFGKGNKNIEAYVMYVSESTAVKKTKEIIKLSGEDLFDEKMRDVIYIMRQKYLCRYIDLIRTVIPSGIDSRPEKWIKIENEQLCEDEKIKKYIIENGGRAKYFDILEEFGQSVKGKIDKMIKENVLSCKYIESQKVNQSKVKIISLADDFYDDDIDKIPKNATVQRKMIEILMETELLSTSDLMKFSGGSRTAIKSLEEKGFVKVSEMRVFRNPLKNKNIQRDIPPELTDCQKKAFDEIIKRKDENKPYLLHGVTGSGKTEVYMRIIENVVNSGKGAIMLVPEIALTPQTVNRFYARFGSCIAVFHSRLSLGERYDEWQRIKNHEANIVIGARSAVFAPMDNIGVIIVDEEHEQSYKSDITPRYHTRDIVELRAGQYNSMVIYASATPAFESYYKAHTGEYIYVPMSERIQGKNMPEVSIVDMRRELEAGNRSVISRRLRAEIEKNLARGEQTILFLNRRGFSTFVLCRSCGYEAKCPNCSISLTYHKFDNTLRCHYCGYSRDNYVTCPECGSEYIRYFGGGTQRVEEEINKIFPSAGTIRMDVDTTGKKKSHEKILESFKNDKIDILIGTQMVSKGLDFANVTLVGIISADTMLNINDFRSGERTFSMLEQVSGRAGRAEKPGRAIIQTYNPDNEAVEMVQRHNYDEFYKSEICIRKAMWYPPYCEIVSILISGGNEQITMQASRFVKNALALLDRLEQKTKVLGPVPAYISKINNKYRFRIMIKCENADSINKVILKMLEAVGKNKKYERVSVIVDKNSNTMY